MIGSSARTSKVYTYMKDHYLNLVIVAKDYDDNGARGSGVMTVSYTHLDVYKRQGN